MAKQDRLKRSNKKNKYLFRKAFTNPRLFMYSNKTYKINLPNPNSTLVNLKF